MYSDAKFLPVSKNANPLFLILDKGGEFWNVSMSDERCETDLGADFAELRSRLLSSVPCLNSTGRLLGFPFNLLDFLKQSTPEVSPELHLP